MADKHEEAARRKPLRQNIPTVCMSTKGSFESALAMPNMIFSKITKDPQIKPSMRNWRRQCEIPTPCPRNT